MRHIVLVHQFALPQISGLSVTVAEVARLLPEVDPDVMASVVSYTNGDVVQVMDREHRGAASVIGFNLHIEAGWDQSLALAQWCLQRGVPFFLYIHDFWPQHGEVVAALVEQVGARVIAITPAIVSDLAAAGIDATLLPAGVAVPESASAGLPGAAAKSVAAVGRLVPRKRFVDVVGAFCQAEIDATLYLRVPPSLVYSPEQDAERLAEIRAEAAPCADRVVIDPTPRAGVDYSDWSVYVSAAEYEGLSMTPLEAVLQGCPFLLSDIAPHRAIAAALLPDIPVLFGVGDRAALAALLEHELRTGERRTAVRERAQEIHATVEADWSLRSTARRLGQLTPSG